MDSIERMRRINDLTRELKQRGFAESSFEAIQQANQIYGPDDLDDDVKHGIIKSSPHDRNVQDETMNETTTYDNRKLDKINENVEMLTNKMNEIIRAINELDARITEIKTKQDKLALAKPEPRPEPRMETRVEVNVEETPVHTERIPEKKPEPQAQAKDEYSTNQRTGNFQSQDVAIDKMFYFGKK